MARCRSWRPRDPEHVELGAPGRNRRKWKVCFNKVADGRVRCDDCTKLLVNNLDPEVRRLLVAENGLGRSVLDELKKDPDIAVASTAALKLGEQPPRRGIRRTPRASTEGARRGS